MGTLPHSHHHYVHSDIVSLSFHFTEPFDIVALHYRLITLLFSRAGVAGQGIYRVKGIIADDRRRERMIIQSVGQTTT